jgi:hypothetical protein
MPRSQITLRWKSTIALTTPIPEVITLIISIHYVVTLVPACIRIQRKSDTFLEGKGKGIKPLCVTLPAEIFTRDFNF